MSLKDDSMVFNCWRNDKGLFIGYFLLFMTTSFAVGKTIYAYSNLQEVKGTVAAVRVNKEKFTYFEMKLNSDKRIFYQVYHSRLKEPAILTLKANDSVKFYTFNYSVKKNPAIMSVGNQSAFDYYPPFYINSDKGIFQVLYL